MKELTKANLLVFLEEEMRQLDTKIFSIDPLLNKRILTVREGLILKRQLFESMYTYLEGLQTSIDFDELNDKLTRDSERTLQNLMQ